SRRALSKAAAVLRGGWSTWPGPAPAESKRLTAWPNGEVQPARPPPMKPERLKQSAMLAPAGTGGARSASGVGTPSGPAVRAELPTVLWVLVPYDVPALAPT